MSTGGPVSQFLRHHFRHFNAAALIEESHTGRFLREILYHHNIVARGVLE